MNEKYTLWNKIQDWYYKKLDEFLDYGLKKAKENKEKKELYKGMWKNTMDVAGERSINMWGLRKYKDKLDRKRTERMRKKQK